MTATYSSTEPSAAHPGAGGVETEGGQSGDGRSERAIGWPRAVLTGLAVIVVGFAGAVLGPNAILTKSLALTRGAREWLATLLFFAVIAILAVTLRWLQHRKLI
jgi:hypothetical protein